MVRDLSQKLRELFVIPELVSPHVLLLIVELDVEKLGKEHTHGALWRPGSAVDEDRDDRLVQQVGQIDLVASESLNDIMIRSKLMKECNENNDNRSGI